MPPSTRPTFFEYANDAVAVTHSKTGADTLASMSDEAPLAYWNELIEDNGRSSAGNVKP